MISKSKILEEYFKCATDTEYAIETYLRTFDKTQEGFVPFKLFEKQKEIIRCYDEYRNNLITKPRQAGISTTTQAYAAIKCAYADKNNPETIIVIANKLTLAKKFLKGIRDFVVQLPRWTWGPDYYGDKKSNEKDIFLVDSQIHIQLPNGSQVIAVATSTDALRGYTPTFLVFDEAAYIDNGAELYAAAVTSMSTGGKAILISCVTDDTFIQTVNGLRQVSDFIDYSKSDDPNVGYYIDEYNILGNMGTRKSNIMVNNGIQDTVILETTNSILEATKTHKLWVYNSETETYGWKLMGEIKYGDYLNIQYGQEIFGDDDDISMEYNFSNKEKKPKYIYNKINDKLAYLIGLYLSEGSVYKVFNDVGNHIGTSITLTCGDDIGSYITDAGFNYSNHDNLHYTISSKYLGSLLEYLGLDLSLKAQKKVIPIKLLSMSKKNTVAMIRGFMDGDGYSDNIRGRIGLNISSKKMCLQFRHLFANFGILTDYQEGVTPKTKLVNVESKFYRLSATSLDAEKFYTKIGFSFGRKMGKQESLKKVNINNRYRIIPNGKKIIRQIIDENNLVNKFRGSGLKVNSLRVKSKTANLSENIFIQFIDYIENKLNVDLSNYNIDKIYFNESKWVKVKKISYSKNKTYDFSLPHNENDFWCHSVLYNNLLGHQTPNGMDPLYYKTYEQAQIKDDNGEPTNGYNVIEMKWYQDPRYNKDLRWLKTNKESGVDESIPESEFTHDHFKEMIKSGYKPTSSWYEGMCKTMNYDSRRIAQELDVSFLGSGGNVIDDEWIMMQEDENVMEPKYIDETYSNGNNGYMWVWEEPIEGHEYIMAVDVARGDGADSSTIVIVDFNTMEEVAEFQGKIPPDLLAEPVFKYGNLYNAYVIVDNIGLGWTTISKLIEMGYKNIHYDKPRPNANKTEQASFTKNGLVPGFNSNGVRLNMIANLESNIRLNTIKIRSKRMCLEMKTFIYKNGKPDHMEGYHDDLLISMGMLLWVLESSFKNLKQAKVKAKAMLNGWVTKDNSQSGNSKYIPKSEINIKGTNTKAPTYLNSGGTDKLTGGHGDHMWLFSGYK